MSTAELACTYAALILEDDGISVTAEKIAALVNAGGLTVESYWPSLFAKLCEKRNIEDLIMNIGSGGGGGAPVAVTAPAGGVTAASAAVAAPAAEEKKEEPKEESDDESLFNLFD
ncbi:large ribosomal subunit protein P1-like [Henckelia pumila]|uniref:large ribosomal subunit protein P1-like n=1 Tax=Henckelia pumila TaxID=405737 RepID=UPI003C6E06E1